MDMVRNVAEALAKARGVTIADEVDQQLFERDARAAIAALREPTDDMIYVGEGYCDFMLPSTHDNSGDGRRKEFRMGWQAAIDHALNPQTPQ